jgi:hypothetical protein
MRGLLFYGVVNVWPSVGRIVSPDLVVVTDDEGNMAEAAEILPPAGARSAMVLLFEVAGIAAHLIAELESPEPVVLRLHRQGASPRRAGGGVEFGSSEDVWSALSLSDDRKLLPSERLSC